MVKQVEKPVVSTEEQKYRDDLYPDVKTIKNKNILCTSCNGSLKKLILKGKPKTHPFLDTLLCEKCYSFFGDGEFSVDEDGSDKYCRWCGQGGTLYLCSTCTAGFCKKCIKRNLPRNVLKQVEEDDWECFCCNVKPLYELRAHCWAANEFAKEFILKKEGKGRKRKSSASEDEAAEEDSKSNKNRKGNDSDEDNETSSRRKRIKLDTKVKPQRRETRRKNLYKPVVDKLSATIKDALKVTDLFEQKAKECLNKKINVSFLKDIETVIKVCGKVDNLLESLESLSKRLRTSVNEYVIEWKTELQGSEEELITENADGDGNAKTVNGVDDETKSEVAAVEKESKENDDDSNESKNLVDKEPYCDSPVKQRNGSDLDGNSVEECENNEVKSDDDTEKETKKECPGLIEENAESDGDKASSPKKTKDHDAAEQDDIFTKKKVEINENLKEEDSNSKMETE